MNLANLSPKIVIKIKKNLSSILNLDPKQVQVQDLDTWNYNQQFYYVHYVNNRPTLVQTPNFKGL